MSAMEESIAGLKSFQEEIGEQQESLKQELCKEQLRELATPTSLGVTRLRPMAPPFGAIRCYCWLGSERGNRRR